MKLENIKDIFKWVGVAIITIVLLLSLDYFIGYQWFKFIEPKKEDVKREVFLNTRSYNEGKIQELIKVRKEYLLADESTQAILRSTIRHSFAEFDENKLSSEELKSFLKQIKY